MIYNLVKSYIFYKITNETFKIVADYSLYHAPTIIANSVVLLTDPFWNNELKKKILGSTNNDTDYVVILDEEEEKEKKEKTDK